jgi:hypothetical protein
MWTLFHQMVPPLVAPSKDRRILTFHAQGGVRITL